MDDDPKTRINRMRVEEVKASGASTAAVSCPFCMQMFEDALAAVDPERSTRAMDIAEIVAEALRAAVLSELTEAAVRRLLDLEAIRDLVRRYAHCIWRKDADGAAALFADDGVMDTGDRASARRPRRRSATPTARSSPPPTFQPFVHDHVIDLTAMRATGTCHLDLRATRDGRSLIGSGCYEDRYVRAGDGWKFASRRLTMHFLVPLREGWGEGESGEK